MKEDMCRKLKSDYTNHPAGILVIDDEPVLRATFKHLLEDQGYRVWVAENGREGMRVYFEMHPDIVITDMVMPDQDGFATIKLLRQDSPSLPIIAMSALVNEEQENPLDTGALCYVTKPVDMNVLNKLIEAILEPENDGDPSHEGSLA